MALLKAEVNRLKSLAESMRSASRPSGPLDNLVSDLGPVAKALEANGSLGTLGYGGMVSEVQQHLERELQTLNDYAETLEHVIDLIEHYETDVIETIGGTVDREDEHLVHDAELVDAAVWATDASVSAAATAGVAAGEGVPAEGGFWDAAWDFLKNGVEKEGALGYYQDKVTGEVFGIDSTSAVSGSFMSGSASLKPEGKWDPEHGDAYVGVTAKAEGAVATAAIENDLGYVHSSAQVSVLTGAAEGTAKANLFKGGKLDPSVELEAKAQVAVLSGQEEIHVGNENFNVHGEAKADVLTAKAGAGIKAGKDGVEVSAGAEAYVATGEIKGGFTILGVQVNATASGHAGGAGASIGGGINTEKEVVKFKVAAGLLVGAGVGFEVDYSGAAKGISDTLDDISAWWNS